MTAKKAAPQFTPPDYDEADMAAFRALHRGEASMEQQKRALDWIINRAAATYDMSFHPDSARLTDFAEGRRFVGLQIVKLVKLNPKQERG